MISFTGKATKLGQLQNYCQSQMNSCAGVCPPLGNLQKLFFTLEEAKRLFCLPFTLGSMKVSITNQRIPK